METCIRHPEAHEYFLRIFPWQIEFCQGNHCAAFLLSYFEGWHNYKLKKSRENKRMNKVAIAHGDPATQDESLWQFHSQKDLERGILGLFKKATIVKGIEYLKEIHVLKVSQNPNPRYKFDKTSFFLFYPHRIQEWLEEIYLPATQAKQSVADFLLQKGFQNMKHYMAYREALEKEEGEKNPPLITLSGNGRLSDSYSDNRALDASKADTRIAQREAAGQQDTMVFSHPSVSTPSFYPVSAKMADFSEIQAVENSNEKQRLDHSKIAYPENKNDSRLIEKEPAIPEISNIENKLIKAAGTTTWSGEKVTALSSKPAAAAFSTKVSLPIGVPWPHVPDCLDSLIGCRLTEAQESILQHLTTVLQPYQPEWEPQFLKEELEYELLDHSFKQANQHFTRKLRTIVKALVEGKWHGSNRQHLKNIQCEQQQEKIRQQQQHELHMLESQLLGLKQLITLSDPQKPDKTLPLQKQWNELSQQYRALQQALLATATQPVFKKVQNS